jgi:exonuclease III
MMYHQNIRGLLNKSAELISYLSPNFPQVLCLTEHHFKDSEIDFTYTDQYKLGTKFCRKYFKNGRVCICMHDTLQCTNTILDEFCNEQNIAAQGVRGKCLTLTIYSTSICRSLTGNFLHILHTKDYILNFLHNNTLKIIICGDFNIYYLNNRQKE